MCFGGVAWLGLYLNFQGVLAMADFLPSLHTFFDADPRGEVRSACFSLLAVSMIEGMSGGQTTFLADDEARREERDF